MTLAHDDRIVDPDLPAGVALTRGGLQASRTGSAREQCGVFRAGSPTDAARERCGAFRVGLPTEAAHGRCGEGGFSILEVLVATTVMTVAVAGLAQLFVVATRANGSARATTFASILAQQKMEQLRGLTWGFDVLGLPLTDTTTDTTVVPELPAGGRGLTPSPPGSTGKGAIAENIEGYCDFVDKFGNSLGSGSTTPPPSTVYIRRWSVVPLPANPDNTVILQVLVGKYTDRGGAAAAAGVTRLPDEARLVSVKTRKAS